MPLKQIVLSNGLMATVDAEDFDWLNEYTWHALRALNTWYAMRIVGKSRRYMHRDILNSEAEVDHEDGNGLHNWRSNLRRATHQQNSFNQKKRRGGSSRYKGVSWCAQMNCWRARLMHCGSEKRLGYFASEILAARAYDAAALKHFGPFARLNFPISAATIVK